MCTSPSVFIYRGRIDRINEPQFGNRVDGNANCDSTSLGAAITATALSTACATAVTASTLAAADASTLAAALAAASAATLAAALAAAALAAAHALCGHAHAPLHFARRRQLDAQR